MAESNANVEMVSENKTKTIDTDAGMSDDNTCISSMFRKPKFKSWIFWLIFILCIGVGIVIVRYSLHYWATFSIALVVMILPCIVSCFVKCKYRDNISIKYALMIVFIVGISSLIFGIIWRANDQCVFTLPDFGAWDEFSKNSNDTILVSMIRSSILASNPHNSQPWKFDYNEQENELYIYFDYGRNIKGVDILFREMHIGIGCAVENALITAYKYGYSVNVIYHDSIETDGKVLACTIQLQRINSSYNVSSIYSNLVPKLYETIPLRHTDRAVYDDNAVIDSNYIDMMNSLNDWPEYIQLYWLNSTELKSQWITLQNNGVVALVGNEEQSKGGYEWVRHTCKAYKKEGSGIWLDAQSLPTAFNAFAKTVPPVSRTAEDNIFVNIVKTKSSTASIFGIIAVKNYTNTQYRIHVGQYWQRIHLYATYVGISMQPLNQAFEASDFERHYNLNPTITNELQTLMSQINTVSTYIDNPIFGFRAGYSQNDNKFKSARVPFTDVLL